MTGPKKVVICLLYFCDFYCHLTDGNDNDDDNESKVSAAARIAPTCNLQPPFQPSSTPVHLQHRFMVRTLNACSYNRN